MPRPLDRSSRTLELVRELVPDGARGDEPAAPLSDLRFDSVAFGEPIPVQGLAGAAARRRETMGLTGELRARVRDLRDGAVLS
ncbi:MAG: hypothetical protein ACE14W_04095 [Candidatus Velamenicoccus archaeovorus]